VERKRVGCLGGSTGMMCRGGLTAARSCVPAPWRPNSHPAALGIPTPRRPRALAPRSSPPCTLPHRSHAPWRSGLLHHVRLPNPGHRRPALSCIRKKPLRSRGRNHVAGIQSGPTTPFGGAGGSCFFFF
jgi:hypothetical protein